jgi:putative DNA-invertase from lambdoid prophage Rac
VINAVAEFERDLLIERTQSGLKRAKAEGKVLGRPAVLSSDQQDQVRARRAQGASLGLLAQEMGVSRSAIHRAEKRTSQPRANRSVIKRTENPTRLAE